MKKENQNHERKIEIISSIDDEIIERASKKRFELWGRVKKRNPWLLWGPMVAGVACVALLCSWLFGILPTLLGRIPVYEGMTVSNTYPVEQEKVWASTSSVAPWEYEPAPMGVAKRSIGFSPYVLLNRETGTDTETETETKAPDLMGENHALYYAKKNEDIYITVHLKNPEAYEILSFTLNGTKYQSYMFEEGSDSDQLVLKINVGEAQGLTQYTIDAIKYVDGTEIKDVRMEGDRTVTVAVYPEDQPTPEFGELRIDHETVSFDVTIQDSFSLIKDSKGRAMARLYLKDTVIDEQELSLEEKTRVTLEGMTPGPAYTLRIMAEYDSMDGTGFGMHQLYEYEEEIISKSHVTFPTLLAENGRVIFSLKKAEGVTVKKVELIDSDNRLVQSGEGDLRTFERLSLGKYHVKVTYTYGEDGAKTGYVISKSVSLRKMCLLTEIVKGAEIVYTGSGREGGITTKDADKSVYAPYSGTIYAVYDDINKHWLVEVDSHDGRINTLFRYLTDVQVKHGEKVVGGQLLGTLTSHFPSNNMSIFLNGNNDFSIDRQHPISGFFPIEN